MPLPLGLITDAGLAPMPLPLGLTSDAHPREVLPLSVVLPRQLGLTRPGVAATINYGLTPH